MSLHKLTAGDGYTYLTRQVAVQDSTERGHSGLADYYAEKGESPGRWWGAGLTGLAIEPGAEVTEAQMKNLFGEGRHPDAERLEQAAIAAGQTVTEAVKGSRLGRPFAIYEAAGAFQREVARRFVAYNLEAGAHWRTPVPAEARAQIRTAVAEEMFAEQHRRAPLDDRERAGFLAQASRQQTTAVAGYDLAFTPVAAARCDDGAMDQVSRFYSGPGGLVAAISSALDAAGLDRATLRPVDLAPVDEFHIRGRAASLEIIDALGLTADSLMCSTSGAAWAGPHGRSPS